MKKILQLFSFILLSQSFFCSFARSQNLPDSTTNSAQDTSVSIHTLQAKLNSYGLEGLNFKMNPEVHSQANSVPVNLNKALEQTILEILYSTDDVESPCNVVSGVKTSDADALSKDQLLVKYLNYESSILILGNDYQGEGFIRPEYEDADEVFVKNWVFFLLIPEIDDHLYWIIVDKSGKNSAYIYGFN